jgi:predicted  nucleic acid-binding Zn-ribbon protein
MGDNLRTARVKLRSLGQGWRLHALSSEEARAASDELNRLSRIEGDLTAAIAQRQERITELENEKWQYKGTLNVRLARISQELVPLRTELAALREVQGGS